MLDIYVETWRTTMNPSFWRGFVFVGWWKQNPNENISDVYSIELLIEKNIWS